MWLHSETECWENKWLINFREILLISYSETDQSSGHRGNFYQRERERDLLWLVEGIQLLQWGVEKLRGWVSVDEWEGLPGLQVTGRFRKIFLCYLSIRERANQRDSQLKTCPRCTDDYWLLFCTSMFLSFRLCRSFSSASYRRWISSSEAGVKRLKTSEPTGGSRGAILAWCSAARTPPSPSNNLLLGGGGLNLQKDKWGCKSNKTTGWSYDHQVNFKYVCHR